MKAVVVRAHGGLDALEVCTLPDPVPRADEVLVEVHAAGVNHLDVWVRKGVPGYEFPLPLVPGNDVAGVVREVGERVAGISPGDEVVLAPATSCGRCAACFQGRDHHCRDYCILGEHRDGGWAEFVVVPRENVLPKPTRLSFVEAASMPLTFLTAWHMLVARARIRPGETVLVQAAGSGVGVAGIQIAKLWGAQVIATAGSPAKLERARALGADHVIDYRREDVPARVKELTAGRMCQVVFDHVGVDSWRASTASLAWQGRLVTCGATTGPKVELNLAHLFFKSLSILGSTMGSKGELVEVLAHAEAGRLAPVVDSVLPLGEAREAQRRLEAREVFGKLVLVPEAFL
ncbi:MAG: alcohol dehydrogenase [Planctomycetota bacterium]|nr:MAG: alcohol dehydrogenase [Planctomycetota bacterium]